MKKIAFIYLVFFYQFSIYAQQTAAFKPLRYEEDYAALRNDSNTGWYNKIKYHPFAKKRSTYISLGGEVRYQYLYFKNEDWGEAPKDPDGFILTRYLVHADLHAGQYFRTFVQLQSSFANGKRSGPSPVDENELDLHQAFVDVRLPLPRQTLLIRLGRQEFSYGSQRLISVRDGPNNRQSFDAAKLVYSTKRLQADAFFSHYVLSKPQIFDDGFNRHTKFWGAYLVVHQIPLLQQADFYYLGLSKASASFDDGQGKELRHSIGSRVWKKNGDWRYDFEGVYQFGKFMSKKIAAWTISSSSSYTLSRLELHPTIGLKTELISGDKKYADDRLNTFNPLFPRGAYFGLAALIGPSNLADIHPSLSVDLSKKTSLSMDYDVFWRYSSNDGIYAPNVSMIYTGKNTASKFIGQQYSTELVYTPNPFLYFRAELTSFLAGSYLRSASPGKDILFTALTAQLKF